MHKIFALVRASWLVGASYRMAIITSFGSLIVTVVPGSTSRVQCSR
jgi:hypothetical protein